MTRVSLINTIVEKTLTSFGDTQRMNGEHRITGKNYNDMVSRELIL